MTRIICTTILLLLQGCCLRFEMVTQPDPATQQWIQDTTAFNQAVKKEVEDHEERLKRLEQGGPI